MTRPEVVAEARNQAMALLFGVPMLFAVALVVSLLLNPLLRDAPFWSTEVVVGGLAAAIGMAVGFLWLRPSPFSAATLFGGGMVLAAILTHGMVRGVSPYYGLAGMAAAGVGGLLVGTWFLVRRSGAGTAAAWCFACLLGALWLATEPLREAVPGMEHRIGFEDERHVAGFGPRIDRTAYPRFLWMPSELDRRSTSESEREVTFRPVGESVGEGRFRILRVDDPATVMAALEEMRELDRSELLDEIERGSTAPLFAGWPMPGAHRDDGTIWRLMPPERIHPDCGPLPGPESVVDEDGALLQVWSFPLEGIHTHPVLPDDADLLDYRTAVREAMADVRHPELIVPDSLMPEAEEIWADEAYNNALVYGGEVGTIAPINCLDALLFAEQHRRVSQLERPTEFLASVLLDETGKRAVVVFGAGRDLFPPQSVYGFDVVDDYLAEGWRYWYALHNHTLQRTGDEIVLGVPAPSTSDISLAGDLAEDRGLQSVRVTNGFYTFIAETEELSRLRSR